MKYSWLLFYSTLTLYYLLTSYIVTSQPSPPSSLAHIAQLLLKKRTHDRVKQPISPPPAGKPAIPTVQSVPALSLNPVFTQALLHAVRTGSLTQLQQQLAALEPKQVSAYVNAQDEAGNTLLSHAAYLGYEDIAEFLILQDASVFIKNKDEQTALHRTQKPETIALLIGYGASPHAIDIDGNTPLHLLAEKDNLNPNAISTLLQMGANPLAQNKKGNTPLLNALITKRAANARALSAHPLVWTIANLAGQSPAKLMPKSTVSPAALLTRQRSTP